MLERIFKFFKSKIVTIIAFFKKLLFVDKKNDSNFVQMIKNIGVAFIFAILIRSFLYEPFHIPSGSMKPGLLEGDFIFVSKFSYGYSRYSFPFGFPPFNGRIFFHKQPKRGEVIVFRLPQNTSINYIKRLVGLPGDRVQMRNGILYINDVAVPKKYIGTSKEYDDPTSVVKEYSEDLDGIKYIIFNKFSVTPGDNTKEFIVPEKYYFFMGDNRDNSVDSRFTVGFVPEENIIGEAGIIFMSSKESLLKFWKWSGNIRFGRIFKVIK